MLIVDAQIHLWSQGLPTNAAHRQVPSYSAEECLMEMDNGGVRAALIHPPGWDPNSLMVAESAAVRYPDRFAILGQFPLDKPESKDLINWLGTRIYRSKDLYVQLHGQGYWPADVPNPKLGYTPDGTSVTAAPTPGSGGMMG